MLKFRLEQKSKRRQAQKEGAIRMDAYIDGGRMKISLGIGVPFTEWDKKRQKFKGNSISKQELLDKEIDRINKIHTNMVEAGLLITKETFRNALKGGEKIKIVEQKKKLSFTSWVENFIRGCEEGEERQSNNKPITKRTIQKYRTVQKQLDEFAKQEWGALIEWEDIDGLLLNKYKSYRANQGLSVNTISKDQAVLKFWMKTAYNRDVHKNKKWRQKEWTKQEMRVVKTALSEDELMALRVAPMSRESLNICRDLFLVSCWTGSRISDLKRLPEIIKNAWDHNGGSCPTFINFVQEKTQEEVSIPVLPELRAIIEKWNGQLPSVPAEQKMNKRVKEVGKEGGLDRIIEKVSTMANDKGRLQRVPLYEILTNHTGRRTFATVLYKKGILSNGQIMSLTGHASETAFLRYLDITNEEISAKAGEKLLKAFAA